MQVFKNKEMWVYIRPRYIGSFIIFFFFYFFLDNSKDTSLIFSICIKKLLSKYKHKFLQFNRFKTYQDDNTFT